MDIGSNPIRCAFLYMIKENPKRLSSPVKKFYKKLKLDLFLEKKKQIYRKNKTLLKSLKKRLRKKTKQNGIFLFQKKRLRLNKIRKSNRKLKYLRKRLLKIKKIDRHHGVIHLLCNKRSIFCTLSDLHGNIKASVSTGMLRVKGKKKKSYYYVPKTGQLLVNYMFKIPYRKFYVHIKGNAFRKKKEF